MASARTAESRCHRDNPLGVSVFRVFPTLPFHAGPPGAPPERGERRWLIRTMPYVDISSTIGIEDGHLGRQSEHVLRRDL